VAHIAISARNIGNDYCQNRGQHFVPRLSSAKYAVCFMSWRTPLKLNSAGQNAVHDFDNNRSRYFLQIWQYEPLSASISNHRKSATYLKSSLGFCFPSNYTSFSSRDLRQLTSGVISVCMKLMSWRTPLRLNTWLFWWTKPLPYLIKMNFGDMGSFSTQLILSL
jgi:hypothetical protein